MLTNFLFGLLGLCYLVLSFISAQHIPNNERGVGAAFLLFVSGAGFALASGLLTWRLAATGFFNWMPATGGAKSLIILVIWLSFAAAVFAGAIFKVEWHPGEFPTYLKWMSRAQVAIWLPLLLVIPMWWFRNSGLPVDAPPGWVKQMTFAGSAISVLMAAGLLMGYLKIQTQRSAAIIQEANDRNDRIHQDHLNRIASQGPNDPILDILSLTGRFHDQDVKDAAVAKVKSHPDWEAELIRLLNETSWAPEVYTFIDGNRVDHPELFVGPLKKSILRISEEVKKDIADANNLQDWHFEHLSIDRLFRAMEEQFTLPGVDFKPEVMQLRQAFDTPKPEQFKDVKFTIVSQIDSWLKRH